MRRFYLKFVIFILPVLLIVILGEVVHRSADNDYKYKHEWLSRNAPHIQILSLGSSHGYYGIDPSKFNYKAFNAAHVSQDIFFDKFIFDSFVDQMDSLKYLILPISYSSPWYSLENSIDTRLVSRYCMYYHYKPHHAELSSFFEVSSFGLRPFRLINEFQDRHVKRDSLDLGMGVSYTLSNRADNWKDSGKVAAERHFWNGIDKNNYRENYTRVEQIIQKCQEKGVWVILVTTPCYVTYRECLDEDRFNMTVHFCESFQIEYDNVLYLNLLADDRFTDEDYYDADHLNEFGAIKLTNLLNELIMEIENRNKTKGL